MLSSIFQDAGIRGVTPFCPQRKRMGLSIDAPGGGTDHFAITREHAEFLRICLDDYINSPAGSQYCGSDGISIAAKSVPSGGEKT